MLVPAHLQVPLAAAGAAVGLVLVYLILRRAVRSYLLRQFTCVPDLERLGTARRGSKLPGTAVICGGSIAGLFAARVCSDHFEKVVVVEPEAWTFAPEARKPADFDTRPVQGSTATYNTLNHKRSRVYQYTAVHLYQVLLLRFARKLFPGFDAIAKRWGLLIQAGDINVSLSGHMLRAPSHEYNGKLPETIWAPRRNLEALFRSLVGDASSCIEYVNGTVTAFQLASDGSVSSVTVRLPNGDARDIKDCALVIDCTGISQTGLKLLSRAIPSFPSNLREAYNPNIVYSTLEYPLPPKFDENLRALNIPNYDTDFAGGIFSYNPDPDVDNRLVSLIRRDASGVVFTMGGWAVDMPVTLDECRAFTKEVKNQAHIPDYFYKVIDLLEPVEHIGTVYEARMTACYKVHYERAVDLVPRNFVAIGDASMRVNPRFGQGVTKSAIGAITIDHVLRRLAPSKSDFSRVFFKRMNALTGTVWDGTRLADYGAPTTTPVPGESLSNGRFLRWYRGQMTRVMNKNPAASSAMWHTLMFLAPPFDIFSPSIVISILWETVWPTA
ncbi:hypothetical protein AURDEDRAFT_151981 [Auricularia subglabra TFB-10046 SS5]|nr:hypothetical protein AURDEDRAFT_151981 [Auricularia subglabra TFB-10046 SS5]